MKRNKWWEGLNEVDLERDHDSSRIDQFIAREKAWQECPSVERQEVLAKVILKRGNIYLTREGDLTEGIPIHAGEQVMSVARVNARVKEPLTETSYTEPWSSGFTYLPSNKKQLNESKRELVY